MAGRKLTPSSVERPLILERLPPIEDLLRSYADLRSFEKVAAKYGSRRAAVAEALRAAGAVAGAGRFRPTPRLPPSSH